MKAPYPLDSLPSIKGSSVLSKPQPHCALISVHGDPSAEVGKEGAGGQNVYVRELGLALAQRGCQVDMFTRREDPAQPDVVEHAPGCRTIRLTAGPTQFIHRDELFDHLPKFVAAWQDFCRKSGNNYSILHTNYWLSGWVGLRLKFELDIPQVHTYHSIGAVKYQAMQSLPKISQVRLATEKRILETADYVVATSPQEEADLRELVARRGRISVIPCGIDTQRFGASDRQTARHQLGIDSDIPLILYVGRFDPRKGIETLVRACARLSQPFQLYLVGGSRDAGIDFQEQQRIRTLVKELGLESITTFAGRIPQSRLPAYYAAANVCVVPSYYEPFGLVAIEAMAAKTPVIASDVGGLRSTVVPDNTGLLVSPRDVKALANGLQQMLQHPDSWQVLGENGWKWVQERFSRAAIANQMYQLYESLSYRGVAIVEDYPLKAG